MLARVIALATHGVFSGPFEVGDQRRAVMEVLEAVGFDADGWRLRVENGATRVLRAAPAPKNSCATPG